jgi:hypothetical protein
MCWRQFMTYSGAEPEAWKYLAVAVPIATIAGPTGAFLGPIWLISISADIFSDTFSLKYCTEES